LFTPVYKASVSFMKIGSVTFMFYFRECMNFYLYFLHVLTDLGEIRYIVFSLVPLRCFGFYENRWCESHTLQSDVNEFLSLLLTFIVHFWVKFIVRDNAYDAVEDLW